MAKIFRREGINRNSEKITYDNGEKALRCYTQMNPHYYKDETGNLNPIDLGRVEVATGTIGDINLKSRNIVSLGIRRDDNPEKYLGLRPDETQALGTEQLEFSIESIDFGGMVIAPDLSRNDIVSINTMDFGNVVVQHTRQFSRQMVKVAGDISDFTIKYRLDLKGLQFLNNSTVKVNEVLRSETTMRTTDLGAVKSAVLMDEIYKPTTGFEIVSGHIDENFLFLSSFGGKDYQDIYPDGYSTHRWDVLACSPIPASNSVMMAVKDCPIVKPDMVNVVKDIIIDLVGGTFDDGVAIVKDGKVVAQFQWDQEHDLFWIGFFCETPDYANFNEGDIQPDCADIGFTPSEITSQFLAAFNKVVNRNAIVLNGEYIVPDEHNRFVIVNEKDEFKFAIRKPKLLDADFKVVSQDTLHTLQKVSENVYEYIKYPDLNCFVGAKNIAYIDVEIVYGSTNDGWIQRQVANTSWNVTHDADGSSDHLVLYVADGVAVRSYSANVKDVISYAISRSTNYFDTSGVVGTIEDVSFNAYNVDWVDFHTNPGYEYEFTAIAIHAANLENPPVTTDFDDFTTYYGYTNCTENTWFQLDFNAAGIAGINQSGITELMTRERTYDYLDSAPPDPSDTGSYKTADYYATDWAGTTYDPYLEITVAAAESGVMPIMSVC